jgi:hypothetical protein
VSVDSTGAGEVQPIPKPKKRRKQSAVKGCDALFSKIVRSTGSCQHCGSPVSLQCAHGFSRRYRAVRWDLRNAFALCAGCHLYFTMRPLEWDDWLRARWGDELYTALRVLALSAPNPKLTDVMAELRALADARGIAA